MDYSQDWNNELADELDALPGNYAAIPMAIADYAKLRDRVRRCKDEKDKL